MNNSHPKFSVSMCVYGKDDPDWFHTALDSVVNQTLRPDQVSLVVDGPVPGEIEKIIDDYTSQYPEMLTVEFQPENLGHGISRRRSVANCRNEIIALMDADDISVPDRFEKTLACMAESKADVVGGDIVEFFSKPDSIVGYRLVPKEDKEIKEYAKSRCPMNQVTVLFRKSVYELAGGYQDWYCDEDYYLWLRMIQVGATFANTGRVEVNVRVGTDMYKRRGGMKYFRSEAKLQRYMLDLKMINLPKYLSNVVKRFVVQVVMPDSVRGWLYKLFARKAAV